jgi:bifunctional non-homologous end joining protein LigD
LKGRLSIEPLRPPPYLLGDHGCVASIRVYRTLRPSKVARPPSGPLWVHEIKHDGFRLMVRREGLRVRLFTRSGHDWADRFPAIVEAASRLRASSFLIDGEAVVCREDGVSDFDALRSRRRDHDVTLIAFDLIEWQGDDLRDVPLLDRKRRLAKLLGKANHTIRFNEHLTHDGAAVFDHACRLGLEGIVSKRIDSPYRSGPSKVWLKAKNPQCEAVRREHEEDWRSSARLARWC